MHFLDLTLPSLAENLAMDEALLLEAEAGHGGEILRVWEWPTPAVVLGAGCRLTEDVNEAACRADAVPIFRRASGGGTVLLGSGCLLFSLVLSYERSLLLGGVNSSYGYILDHIRDALRKTGLAVEQAGISDLAAGDRKFSGNAQQRKRTHLLHHGTLLYGFDVLPVSRYLHMPSRQPDYRQGRHHEVFLSNIPLHSFELKRCLREAWQTEGERLRLPHSTVRQLVADKYTQSEWIRRR
jgi:lipoate-protein ligase A